MLVGVAAIKNKSESALNGIDLNSANYNQYCPFCRSVVYALYNRAVSNETTELVDFVSATAAFCCSLVLSIRSGSRIEYRHIQEK